MQNDTCTLEDSWSVNCQIDPSILFLDIYPTDWKPALTQEITGYYLEQFYLRSLKLETTKTSLKKSMDKYIIVHLYNEILFSNKNKL